MRRVFLTIFVLCRVCLPAFSQTEPWLIGTHQFEAQVHHDTPTNPKLIGDRNQPIIPLVSRDRSGQPCATVFGYLPYWCDADYLQFDLLTHLACFSVEVNPNGSLGNDHGWPWTALINQSHQSGVKVILVATLFDSGDIYTLITNPTYKNNFFVNIKAKMLEGNADGLNIDFEGGSSWVTQINTFMADLTAYLHYELPGSEVTFAGPSVNWSSWDLPGLAASCDGIFIMGYSFWGSWSSTSGPNAPLTGWSHNITDTVLNQYGEVTQNNPEKLILGVPYYGRHWTTTSPDAFAPVIDFIGSTFFSSDQPASLQHGVLWDSISQTAWYRWQVGSTWHQVWFDNAESLGLKYDLAIENNLQGVGMWALGYDGSRPELWDLLEDRFSDCTFCCDFNQDGYLNIEDFAAFQFCMQGPGETYEPDHYCIAGDVDADQDVDLTDFVTFQLSFGN